MALTQPDNNRPLMTGICGHEAPGVPARPASPWLTAVDAAAHVGYDMTDPRKAADALRHLARRHGLPLYRRGRRLLVSRSDLDRWLRGNRVAL